MLTLTKSTDKDGVMVWTLETVAGYVVLGPVQHVDEHVARLAAAGLAALHPEQCAGVAPAEAFMSAEFVAFTLGRKGGAVKSAAKTNAARKNGAKGGRPRMVK